MDESCDEKKVKEKVLKLELLKQIPGMNEERRKVIERMQAKESEWIDRAKKAKLENPVFFPGDLSSIAYKLKLFCPVNEEKKMLTPYALGII